MIPTSYSPSQVAEAKQAFEDVKREMQKLRPRTAADITFFREANVTQISVSLGGMHIAVVNL